MPSMAPALIFNQIFRQTSYRKFMAWERGGAFNIGSRWKIPIVTGMILYTRRYVHTTFKRWNRSVSSDQFVGKVVSFAMAVSRGLSWLQSSTASPCAVLGRRRSPAKRAWRSHAHVPASWEWVSFLRTSPDAAESRKRLEGGDAWSRVGATWVVTTSSTTSTMCGSTFLLGVYYYQLSQASRQIWWVGRGKVPFMWCVCMGGIQKLASQ